MWYTGAAFVGVWAITLLSIQDVRIVNAADPPVPDAQQKCTDLKALKSSDPNPAYQITEWVVGRVTVAKDPPPDPKINTCSVYTFYDACKTGAIHYTITEPDWSIKDQSTICFFAYYTESNNLVHYRELDTKEDKNYNVWLDKLEKMETIDDQSVSTPVDPIPQPVADAHGKEFALVAADIDGKWIMHRVCGTDIVWVSFPKADIAKAEADPKAYMSTFYEDIDSKLTEMTLDPATVIEIETTLKIQPPQTSPSPPPSSSSPPPAVSSPPVHSPLQPGSAAPSSSPGVSSSPVPSSSPSPKPE